MTHKTADKAWRVAAVLFAICMAPVALPLLVSIRLKLLPDGPLTAKRPLSISWISVVQRGNVRPLVELDTSST